VTVTGSFFKRTQNNRFLFFPVALVKRKYIDDHQKLLACELWFVDN